MSKTAVVIFNLGGPDRLESVRPFLFNLFNDPAILRYPAPVRWLLARLISARRTPVAEEIYRRIGGRSPILDLTRDQAAALAQEIGAGDELRVFVAMRYWHPFIGECIAEVLDFGAEDVVLLPLYPQFSTTTTGSFLTAWRTAADQAGLAARTRAVCCYPAEPGFVASLARHARTAIEAATAAAIEAGAGHGRPRVLFSAHGLPEKFIDAGDPYQNQIERTVAAVVAALDMDGLDYVICYQSRVGPTRWLRPYTDEEIMRAGRDRIALAVVPVAFVSEHSETLVELDMEYARIAEENNVPVYVRAPTVGTDAAFIAGLGRLVAGALASDEPLMPGCGGERCSGAPAGCPLAASGGGR
jgi:ferrochelatase